MTVKVTVNCPSDRNGYRPSILQKDLSRCFICGRTDRKLDRHEVFGGANRDRSKQFGLWVMLCHEDCHEGKNGVHQNAEQRAKLREYAQRHAMEHYDWTISDFRRVFGKNYLEVGDG